MLINDRIIRDELIQRIYGYKHTSVLEELSLFTSPVRADIVTINGHLTGYEIKSDVDSLERLKHQCIGYDKAFEMNYLVVGEKLKKRAVDIIPGYWGVILVSSNGKNNMIKIKQLRRAKLNPSLDFESFLFLVSLSDLKKEIIPLLTEKKQKSAKNLIKQDLVSYISSIASNVEKRKIKAAVRENIRKRPRVKKN